MFNWAVIVYLIFFFLFIFYSKEKIDKDSSDLAKGSIEGNQAFNEASEVLNKQFKNGINIETFYKDIEVLLISNQARQLKKESSNYF